MTDIVERLRAEAERTLKAGENLAKRLADRDTVIAEALAFLEPHDGAHVSELRAILSRSPQGAADRLRAETLEEAAEVIEKTGAFGPVVSLAHARGLRERAAEYRKAAGK